MLDALAPEFRPEHAGLSPADVNELEEVDLDAAEARALYQQLLPRVLALPVLQVQK